MSSIHRRTLLRSLGPIAGALFAGCSTSTNETAEGPPTPSPTKSPTATETQTGTALTGGAGPLPEKSWPLPHRGITNGGYLPGGPLFKTEPEVDWQVVPSTPPDQSFSPDFTVPVINDDRLYTVNRLWFGPNEEGPDQHFLRAYDTATGDELWEFTIPAESGRDIPTRPAIGDDVVLVGQGQRLHAVGIAEGVEQWSRELDESIEAVYPTRDQTFVKTNRSVVALNSDAAHAWTKKFEAFPETLAQGTANLYVTVSRRLLALDPTTGDVRWSQMLPAVDGGYAAKNLITVADGVFALQHSGDLYAFSKTGRQVWQADDQYGSLSTDGSRLYATAEDILRAFAVTTGDRLWELRCEDVKDCNSSGSFRKPVVTDSALYASHSSGRLVAVRPNNGTVLWSLEAPTDFDNLSLGPDAIYGVGFEFDPLVKLQPS